MGLDNIPAKYPCKVQGVALLNDSGQIRCQDTIEAGLCPYVNTKKSDPLTRDLQGVVGIMGSECWYRGKYGNYLLNTMASNNLEFPLDGGSFYGDMYQDNEVTGISPERCIEMSKIMVDYIEPWTYVANSTARDENEAKMLIEDWIYAAFWLKYVGENCEGSVSWY